MDRGGLGIDAMSIELAGHELGNLRKKAIIIDLSTVQLPRMKVKIDIGGLNKEVKQDLEKNDFMDVFVHCM